MKLGIGCIFLVVIGLTLASCNEGELSSDDEKKNILQILEEEIQEIDSVPGESF